MYSFQNWLHKIWSIIGNSSHGFDSSSHFDYKNVLVKLAFAEAEPELINKYAETKPQKSLNLNYKKVSHIRALPTVTNPSSPSFSPLTLILKLKCTVIGLLRKHWKFMIRQNEKKVFFLSIFLTLEGTDKKQFYFQLNMSWASLKGSSAVTLKVGLLTHSFYRTVSIVDVISTYNSVQRGT